MGVWGSSGRIGDEGGGGGVIQGGQLPSTVPCIIHCESKMSSSRLM